MQYRHEVKHEINPSDVPVLRQRLKILAEADSHAVDGRYTIRSLYFDNLYDKALMEKINGVNHREKFRIRYYDGNLSLIQLEKKSKHNGLCCKQKEVLTLEETGALLHGEIKWMNDIRRPLAQELYLKMTSQGLRPRTIVDYTREAYTYTPGNVRITMDHDIRTGMNGLDFLNPACVMMPVGEDHIILEVKWDTFLPDIIRNAIQLGNRREQAFSKYAACRMYG
ncbi:MAG: polyphosphate polymerase domain-containing protein [Wujia sp.]